MEENTQIIKKLVKRPIQPADQPNKGGLGTFFYIMNGIMLFMVFIIFVRGFNVKGTVRDESDAIKKELNDKVIELQTKLETARQIDKNEILSAFALYSRLDAQSLKEQEEYHKQQQAKYENMATQYNQGLNSLAKTIKQKKDSVK